MSLVGFHLLVISRSRAFLGSATYASHEGGFQVRKLSASNQFHFLEHLYVRNNHSRSSRTSVNIIMQIMCSLLVNRIRIGKTCESSVKTGVRLYPANIFSGSLDARAFVSTLEIVSVYVYIVRFSLLPFTYPKSEVLRIVLQYGLVYEDSICGF